MFLPHTRARARTARDIAGVYTCIENMRGQKQQHDACLRDDNDDEPTGLLDFEREERWVSRARARSLVPRTEQN